MTTKDTLAIQLNTKSSNLSLMQEVNLIREMAYLMKEASLIREVALLAEETSINNISKIRIQFSKTKLPWKNTCWWQKIIWLAINIFLHGLKGWWKLTYKVGIITLNVKCYGLMLRLTIMMQVQWILSIPQYKFFKNELSAKVKCLKTQCFHLSIYAICFSYFHCE